MIVLATIVPTLLLNDPFGNPRGDYEGGNTEAHTVEGEGDLLAVLAYFRVG